MIEGNDLLFLDTETTGNVVATDRLCQVCYKDADGIKTKNFKPPIPISIKAMSITHITNEMVAEEAAFIGSDFAHELQEKLRASILVAHNARFDIAILKAEGIEVPRHIDTLRLVRYLDAEQEIPEYNLQFLRYYFGIDVKADPHSADGDVIVLEAVFARLFAMAESRAPGSSREEILKRMMDISAKPSLIRSFTFGKHAGELVTDVAKSDRSYLEWFWRTKKDEPDEEDWVYTLEQALR